MTFWTNLNPIFNRIADLQEIEPGSAEWNRGGIAAYSGQTGSHAAYGFKHDCYVDEFGSEYVKWVIANYLHRPCYYENAIARKYGYNKAGRPKDWSKNTHGDEYDLDNNARAYVTTKGIVAVSGPDDHHFHVGPLVAIFKQAPDIEVKVRSDGKTIKVQYLVPIVLTYLLKSFVGQFMKDDETINEYVPEERAGANFIELLNACILTGAGTLYDVARTEVYFEKYLLKRYETHPYLSYYKKIPTIDGLKAIQVYNGLFWLLPQLYWLRNNLQSNSSQASLCERITKIIERHALFVEDLEQLAPGAGTRMDRITVPEGLNFSGGLTGLSTENVKIDTVNDWTLWGFTAQRVAAAVLNSKLLKDSSDKIFNEYEDETSLKNKVWLVDATGEYVV